MSQTPKRPPRMPLTSQRLIYIHDCRLDQLTALLSPHPLHSQSSSPLTVHVPLQCLTASRAELNHNVGSQCADSSVGVQRTGPYGRRHTSALCGRPGVVRGVKVTFSWQSYRRELAQGEKPLILAGCCSCVLAWAPQGSLAITTNSRPSLLDTLRFFNHHFLYICA